MVNRAQMRLLYVVLYLGFVAAVFFVGIVWQSHLTRILPIGEGSLDFEADVQDIDPLVSEKLAILTEMRKNSVDTSVKEKEDVLHALFASSTQPVLYTRTLSSTTSIVESGRI